jgi:hypothetical protein
LREHPHHAFGDTVSVVGGHSRQDQQKLIAAIADGDVLLTDALLEQLAREAEQTVASLCPACRQRLGDRRRS